MYKFSDLLKKIREEANLTQADLANRLEVSTVLIAMVESGQKDVSKKLILKLADAMKVHPSSITPFIFVDEKIDGQKISKLERSIINLGEKMQENLIKKKSKLLGKDVKY